MDGQYLKRIMALPQSERDNILAYLVGWVGGMAGTDNERAMLDAQISRAEAREVRA